MATANITPWWCTPGDSVAETTSMKSGAHHSFTAPTPSGCLYGAYSVKITGDADTAAALTRFNTHLGAASPGVPGATGNIQLGRAYDFASWTTNLQTQIGLSGVGAIPIIGSFESNGGHSWADIGNGVYDTDIKALLAYVTANRGPHPFYAVIGHEYNQKISAGNYTFASYAPAALHYLDLIGAHGDAGIIPMSLFSANGTSAVTTALNNYWPTLGAGGPVTGQKYGAFGIDIYQKGAGSNHTETAQDVSENYFNAIHTATGESMPIFVPELGVNIGTPLATQPQTLDFIDSCSWYNGQSAGVCWFDSGSNTIYNLSDCMAAYEALILA